MKKKTYQQCDAVVAVSPSLKDLIIQEYQIPKQKIFVIPNAFSRADLNWKEKKQQSSIIHIGFVGLLTHWIGIHTLLEALPKLSFPVRVSILGEGPYKRELEKMVEKLGITDKVYFKGFVARPELFETMDQFDLGYSGHIPLSTDRYHSPMKLYEYLGRGVPVVASDDEDSKKLIGDNKHGFIFKRNDPISLAETLKQAYQCRDQWTQMGTQGRDLIAKSHLWEHRVQWIEKNILGDFLK